MVKDLLNMNDREMDFASLDSLETRIFGKMCSCNVELLEKGEKNEVLDEMLGTVNDIFGKGCFGKKEDLVLYLSTLC